MNNGAEILRSAMAAAAQGGPELATDTLLAVIAKHDTPLNAMADWDDGNEMFAAIQEQFGFIHFMRATGKTPSQEEFERLVALLRWIIRECAEWRSVSDPKREKLTALFVAVQFAEMGGSFWEAVPDGSEPSGDLIVALGQLITKISSSFTTRGLQAPIWEAEAVERFQKADAAGDWKAIVEGWRLIEHSFFPGVTITQSVQCLCRFDFDLLVQSVSELRQIAAAMTVVRCLRPDDAIRLAAWTYNPYVQFAAVYENGHGKPNAKPVSEASQDLLTNILTTVAGDPARWSAWMEIFNHFPTRFLLLQPALGRALAVTDEAASQVYFDALHLYWMDQNGRQPVAECFRSFRSVASDERRRVVWGQAYARWIAWRFDAGDSNTHPNQIGQSALDYAVVGYAVECLGEDERQANLRFIIAKLSSCDDAWYEDLSDCLSEWNRLLSEFQPFAHAVSVAQSGGDWLMEGKQYLPFDPQAEPYAAFKFRMARTNVKRA